MTLINFDIFLCVLFDRWVSFLMSASLLVSQFKIKTPKQLKFIISVPNHHRLPDFPLLILQLLSFLACCFTRNI